MPDHYVTVHRGADAVEAEIVRDVLVDAGIAARLLAFRREAPLGVTAAVEESRVDVPAGDVEEARAVVRGALESLRAQLAVDEDEEGPAEEQPRPLRHLLAAGVSVICPGGGHFYARRPLTAIAIAAGEIAAVVAYAHGGREGAWGGIALLLLILADVVFAQLAVRAWNRGTRRGQVRQAAHGLAILATAGVLGSLVGPVVQSRRRGGPARWQELRQGAPNPNALPFPLHLDFRR